MVHTACANGARANSPRYRYLTRSSSAQRTPTQRKIPQRPLGPEELAACVGRRSSVGSPYPRLSCRSPLHSLRARIGLGPCAERTQRTSRGGPHTRPATDRSTTTRGAADQLETGPARSTRPRARHYCGLRLSEIVSVQRTSRRLTASQDQLPPSQGQQDQEGLCRTACAVRLLQHKLAGLSDRSDDWLDLIELRPGIATAWNPHGPREYPRARGLVPGSCGAPGPSGSLSRPSSLRKGL